ncbi:MAG: protein-export chaperone SecB [Lysobacteraceae bacterium]|uniref:protein-export chaperone SecB n=1 Tax=Denitratimonas sp. CY0512 TaxID=3131940 RepID=UPI0016942E44|nr:protein-export chaperone SecB [Gammaproteobacteria bacterium]
MADDIANGAASAAATDAAPQPQFGLQRIYVKDASFEAPNAPQIFQEQGQPELQLNLGQKVSNLSEGVFEVVLTVSLTCTINSKNAYLAEVQQAGIFNISGLDAQNTDGLLGTYAPNALFPYARRLIADLVQDGGFQPFLLQPINFDQIYAEALRRRQQEAAGEQQPAAGNA